MVVLCLALFMGWLCLVHVYVWVAGSCSVGVLFLLYADLLTICSVLQGLTRVMSFEERRLSNGSIGFSTGSLSLDRHVWAARCGYFAGPEMVRLGPRLVRMSE